MGGRAHLVKKRVTRKDGVETTVWVNPDKGEGDEKRKDHDWPTYGEMNRIEERAALDPNDLSSEEYEAVTNYTHNFVNFNDLLRDYHGGLLNMPDTAQGEAVQGEAPLLDEIIERNEVPKDLKVGRVMVLDPKDNDQRAMFEYLSEMEEGDLFTDHGYMSTTMDEGFYSLVMDKPSTLGGNRKGHHVVGMKINVPEGSNGVIASKVGFEKEHEVILPRDSILVFRGKEKDENGRTNFVFDLEKD